MIKSLCFIFLSSQAFAASCLTLNGLWQGDCLYRSTLYGDLSGDIEFNFKQTSCDSLEINQQLIQIPGEWMDRSQQGNELSTTKLALKWGTSQKTKLLYTYQYQFAVSGKVKDQVTLDGQFEKMGLILKLTQKGFVDNDAVQIFCDLRLRSR